MYKRQAPAWGRLVLVNDPRVDAKSSSGNRLSIPAIVALYGNEASARAAVEEEGGTVRKTASAGKAKPPYPAKWVGYEPAWEDEMKKFKQANNGVLPPAPVLATIAGSKAATPEDIAAWWEAV